jgi:hypothetical protein
MVIRKNAATARKMGRNTFTLDPPTPARKTT